MNTELEKAMLGQVLEDGWVICGSRTRSSVNTGACHSVGFTADHPDGRKAFVKAMNQPQIRRWRGENSSGNWNGDWLYSITNVI